MRALVVLVVLAGRAEARDWMGLMDTMQGGSTLHYELTGLDDQDGPDQLVLAGARLHGFAGPSGRWALQMGLDLAAGGTIHRGGFAYDVALLPLGFAVRLGATGYIGIAGGVGALGATPTADDALSLPGELTLELGNRVRLLGRARASYLAFTGEHRLLEGMVGLRIGHHYEDYGFPSGNGYFVAASFRELGDARMIGATIGYSIDLATPRRSRRHAE
jgi:hypothetical protein